MKDFINELAISYHNYCMTHAESRATQSLHMNRMLARIHGRSKRQVARMERVKGLV